MNRRPRRAPHRVGTPSAVIPAGQPGGRYLLFALLPLAASAGGSETGFVIVGLLLGVAVLVSAARMLSVPYPIFLVFGGLAVSLLPGVPRVEIDPDLVLLIFLPPLIYSASFFTSLRDMRQNMRPISLLSIGLVLATCLAVAAAAHALIPGITWEASFVLGAVLGPTDPVAATALAGRLGLPNRVVVIAEGESLVNDATALVAYRTAIAAVVSGSFGLLDAAGDFALAVLGGVAIGCAVGFVITEVRRRLDDPPVEITISLLTGYLAYLPAEELGVSGVVAAVTSGLYLGFRAAELTTAQTRLQSNAVWQILVFLLNSTLFLLIGLQLPRIVDAVDGGASLGDLIWYGVVIGAVVIGVRVVWTWVFAYLPHWLFRSLRARNPVPPPRNVAIISWMGMRGAVSLAAALAVPLETDAGAAFPARDAILLVTFVVILMTLCVQGLSLPLAVRVLGVHPDDVDETEEDRARLRAVEAALAQIEQLRGLEWSQDESVDRLHQVYEYRQRRFTARVDGARWDGEDPDGYEGRAKRWTKMTHAVISAQREAVEALRREGAISNDTARRIERDLDLEETRFNRP